MFVRLLDKGHPYLHIPDFTLPRVLIFSSNRFNNPVFLKVEIPIVLVLITQAHPTPSYPVPTYVRTVNVIMGAGSQGVWHSSSDSNALP